DILDNRFPKLEPNDILDNSFRNTQSSDIPYKTFPRPDIFSLPKFPNVTDNIYLYDTPTKSSPMTKISSSTPESNDIGMMLPPRDIPNDQISTVKTSSSSGYTATTGNTYVCDISENVRP
ncbi:hypothetical protein Ahia01_000233200, partial [Argonauta hians]